MMAFSAKNLVGKIAEKKTICTVYTWFKGRKVRDKKPTREDLKKCKQKSNKRRSPLAMWSI